MLSLMCRVLVLLTVVFAVEGARIAQRRPVVKAAVVDKELKALEYLGKYGYLGKNVKTKLSLKEPKSAIMQFQKMAGLRVTGLLDAKTLAKMDQPRCGMSDTNNSRDYRTVGRWPKKDLTYFISKYPASSLSPQQVDQEIARAFQVWSDYTDLTFRVIDRRRDQRPDINIKFERGNHGDGSSFDGPGGTLAHAFFPTDGKTHFDDSEPWTMRDYRGINLFQVAAHEIGHSLGLDHSEVSTALMAPFYQTYQPSFRLDNDDIRGIQRLYGQKTNQGAPPPSPPTGPVVPGWPFNPTPTDPTFSLCQDLTFDTIFTDLQDVTYIIKGSQYWVLGGNTPPQNVQSKWAGLPARIDAAFSHKNIGKTYFFSGAYFWRFNGDRLDYGYPKRIAESFPGIPDNVDAAFVWSRNSQIYFFKGSEYWKYDYTKLPAVEQKYPQRIGAFWRVVPDSPDAAFNFQGSTHFAKGTSYSKFLDASLSLDSFGYRSIGILFGCPNSNRLSVSKKDKIWTAAKMKPKMSKKMNSVPKSQGSLIENLTSPTHAICVKHPMCKRFP